MNDKLQGEREANADHEVVKFIKEKMELFESMGDKVISGEYCNILGYIRWLEARAAPVVATAVDRFLGWKLPDHFSPDAGISFKPPTNPEWWPIGTNLLSADQAKAMFDYCLSSFAALASDAEPVAKKLISDPDDERSGSWFSLEDLERLKQLPPGTKLYTAPSSAAQAVEAVALWGLIAAMKAARRTLDKENDSEDSAIQDTIWHSPTETLFDFMDAAIKKAEALIPTEAAQPAIPEATKGHTFPPQELGDLWTAGINLGRHGNAIECYRETKEQAEALRDKVLWAITSQQAAEQVERDAKDAELFPIITQPQYGSYELWLCRKEDGKVTPVCGPNKLPDDWRAAIASANREG